MHTSKEMENNPLKAIIQNIKFYLLVFILLITCTNNSHAKFRIKSMEDAYQQWADDCRVLGIFELGYMFEKYYSINNKYPFQNNKKNIGINLSVVNNIGFTPNSDIKLLYWKELRAELKKVFGEDVSIPLDPQKIPIYVPAVIQIYIDKDNYYIAANLYHPRHPFTRTIKENHHKLEISSTKLGYKKIYKLNDITKKERQEILNIKEIPKCPKGTKSGIIIK